MAFYLFYFVVILASLANSNEVDLPSPVSRRLLLAHRVQSSHIDEKKSSPPKFARAGGDWNSLPVYIRPKVAHQHEHKVRSYSHLLKPKLHKNQERTKSKRSSSSSTKKKRHEKRKNTTQYDPALTSKGRDLIPVDLAELDRCRALLRIDHVQSTPKDDDPTSKVKQPNENKNQKKEKSTVQTKRIKANVDPVPPPTNSQSSPKKTSTTTEKPVATPFVSTTKSKKEKSNSPPPPVAEEHIESVVPDGIYHSNNSVVDRAYHFVKNIFQLSDDILEMESGPKQPIIDLMQQQQRNHHHSRKLLSIDNLNDDQFETPFDRSSSASINEHSSPIEAHIVRRRLLSTKTTKSASKTNHVKGKKSKSSKKITDASKPKVGWAYRYRISRYLAAQKMPRGGGGKRNKLPAVAAKTKVVQKKSPASGNCKVTKRKLLEHRHDDDAISDQEIVDSVNVTQKFVPKRQLLASKTKKNDTEKTDELRQSKSFDELTDPVAIVRAYERGLFKPRVGWQFRYRISRYIDHLRENIREDQERLKSGLQAIKRKSPQELSGRRKRVLDKPFSSDRNDVKKADEKKPNVGWGYRYRISKMLAAKERQDDSHGEKDDKRRIRLEEKKKQQNLGKDADLDPELRQISNEGRRVGWAYRYRVRQKLDHLKRQRAVYGIPFDLETLTQQGESKPKAPEKKVSTTTKLEPVEERSKEEKPDVGWGYRYRVSKMRDAQKKRGGSKSKKSTDESKLDPVLSGLQPEDRAVGWKYRYRIRRKLDSSKTRTDDKEIGKRSKKKPSSKEQTKDKISNRVEESIEKMLNIDDIDKTPFMEYFRRGSSHILFGLIPAAKRSICLLPLPMTFSFCKHTDNGQQQQPPIEKTSSPPTGKLRTKKERRAKQFIRSRPTKLGADDKVTERRVDEAMRTLYKTPSLPPLQTPPLPVPTAEKSSKRSRATKKDDRRSKGKPAGVKSKKSKSRKIVEQTTPKPDEIIASTTEKATVESCTPPPTVQTSTTPRLRTISEVIREEATTLLTATHSDHRTTEDLQEETNEGIHERAKDTARPLSLTESSASSRLVEQSETNSNGDNRQSHDTTDSVHDQFDVDQNKDSS